MASTALGLAPLFGGGGRQGAAASPALLSRPFLSRVTSLPPTRMVPEVGSTILARLYNVMQSSW